MTQTPWIAIRTPGSNTYYHRTSSYRTKSKQKNSLTLRFVPQCFVSFTSPVLSSTSPVELPGSPSPLRNFFRVPISSVSVSRSLVIFSMRMRYIPRWFSQAAFLSMNSEVWVGKTRIWVSGFGFGLDRGCEDWNLGLWRLSLGGCSRAIHEI